MDPATALPLAPPQRNATSSAESESSSAHEEDDLSLASDWTNEDERVSQGDGQPRVNDKSPTIDNDVQDSLLVVSTSATDVETLRLLHVYMYVLLHVQRTPEHSPRAPRQRVMQAASWSGGRMHTVSTRTRSVALVYRQFALASTACSQPTLLQLPAWAWARH